MDRIALLSLHSSPLATIGSPNAGGMNVYVRRLAEELCGVGLQVDIFTRRADAQQPDVIELPGGTRVIHLAAGPAQDVAKSVLPLHIPQMASAMRAFMEREGAHYDVLHSHYWLSGLVALRVAEGTPVPVVHMFHTLSLVKEFYGGSDDTSDSALRLGGERRVLECVDAVVGATAAERDEIRGLYGIDPPLFSVIPPGVDVEEFRPRDKQQSRCELGIDADHVILFVGRPDHIKRLDVLLTSVAQIKASTPGRLKLIVVGSPGTDNRYETLAQRLNLADVVDFRRIVPQAQLPYYYSAADVCAIPSAYESFGMVAVESMACQTPVVAFSVGGLAATVRHGETGFLAAPNDIRSYPTLLRDALLSDRLDCIGRRARLSVQRYRWPSIALRTLDLYEKIASLEEREAESGVGV